MKTITPTATLPKILAVLSCQDHGPCDPEPTAQCPHCGAGGRYIYSFLCEDGKVRGAMSGCIQLFPKHQFVDKIKTIFTKQRDYAKKGWKLATWDETIIKASEDLQNEKITFPAWEHLVQSALSQRAAYMAQKYGARRHGRR